MFPPKGWSGYSWLQLNWRCTQGALYLCATGTTKNRSFCGSDNPTKVLPDHQVKATGDRKKKEKAWAQVEENANPEKSKPAALIEDEVTIEENLKVPIRREWEAN